MKIQLLAFASAGDAVGATRQDIDLSAGSTVADLRALLDRRHPGLAPLWPRLAIAVNGELADSSTPLADGAEVALLPPVSGGSSAPVTTDVPTEAGQAQPVALLDAPIDVSALTTLLLDPARGAIVTFLGTVRNHHRGRPVQALTYTAYRPMALARLQRIVSELEAEDSGLRVAIHHRLGHLQPGDISVAILTASPHREAAYTASRTALERLKAEVPIWKQEHYGDGSVAWREEESLVGG